MFAHSATASAPASIGNVGVGFDILGQAFDAVRDTVTATREAQAGVRLGQVTGLTNSLPKEPGANTALAAARAVLEAAGSPFGMRLSIDKGVPLSAGMGGSAASAVAAAAAANALLGSPFAVEELLPFALEGERVASDPPHWDNVMASLLGGLVLAAREKPRACAAAAGASWHRRDRAASRSEGRNAKRAPDPRRRGADAARDRAQPPGRCLRRRLRDRRPRFAPRRPGRRAGRAAAAASAARLAGRESRRPRCWRAGLFLLRLRPVGFRLGSLGPKPKPSSGRCLPHSRNREWRPTPIAHPSLRKA